ncbi:hypothetical protein [Psychroserpens sp.]|jgi:hypothetical protein|uniref:hypothetical protein n=1 Tax=Psychroserpens sp. TaxID=2020870 RepID=UPI0039E6E9EF
MTLLSLNSYQDLLFKCEFELEKLQNCSTHPDYDFILFNIVIGLNHLFDWYLKEEDLTEEQKINCINSFNPYQSLDRVSREFKSLYRKIENFPQINAYQESIRDLSNKAKHFNKTQIIEKQDRNYTVTCGSPLATCGNDKAVSGGFDHYIYSIKINGSDENLQQVISALIISWRGFCI